LELAVDLNQYVLGYSKKNDDTTNYHTSPITLPVLTYDDSCKTTDDDCENKNHVFHLLLLSLGYLIRMILVKQNHTFALIRRTLIKQNEQFL